MIKSQALMTSFNLRGDCCAQCGQDFNEQQGHVFLWEIDWGEAFHKSKARLIVIILILLAALVNLNQEANRKCFVTSCPAAQLR